MLRIVIALVLCAPCSLRAQVSPTPSPEEPLRVMLRARAGGADRLTPLRYVGGFETKTLLFETLVRRGPDGRIAPGLASAWRIEDGGATFRFELRDGARFHDGTPVTAAAVVDHFQRWIGRPEHDWLPVNRHIRSVESDGERGLVVRLDRPFSLLDDLCAINPCAVLGPAARDWEGEFVRPVGTGAFRFEQASADGRRWTLAPVAGDGPRLEVTFVPRGRDRRPIDALLADEIDLFVGGWDEDLPDTALAELADDERFRVHTAPGSSVVYLSFRLAAGATADVAVRRRIAAAIDRQALVQNVEHGRAEPCTTWAAPALAAWPRGRSTQARAAVPDEAPLDAGAAPLRIAPARSDARALRVAVEVARQLCAAGLPATAVDSRGEQQHAVAAALRAEDHAVGTVTALTQQSGEVRKARGRVVRRHASTADVVVEITYGAPYDPHHSLAARFGDEDRLPRGASVELHRSVRSAMQVAEPLAREAIYAEIQTVMDRDALVVPLYVPNRVALSTAAVAGVTLGPDVYHVDLRGVRRAR